MAFLRTVALALALLGSQAWADHVPMTMTARAAERDGAEARVMRAIRRTADKRGFGGLEPRTGTFEFDYVDGTSTERSRGSSPNARQRARWWRARRMWPP
jgi:hypothetical protein